jgi:hypothetical protein
VQPIAIDALTHEAPVLEGKAPLQRVEGQVAARALGVVVRAGHLRAGRLEAAAGDERGGRGGAESGTGEHLAWSAERAIGGASSVRWVVWWSGEWSCLRRAAACRRRRAPAVGSDHRRQGVRRRDAVALAFF